MRHIFRARRPVPIEETHPATPFEVFFDPVMLDSASQETPHVISSVVVADRS